MDYEYEEILRFEISKNDDLVIQEIYDNIHNVRMIDFRIYSKYLNRFTHRGFRMPLTQFKEIILPFLNVKYGKDSVPPDRC